MTMEKIKKWADLAYVIASAVFCIIAWPISGKLTFSQIQPIASAVSTFAGVLFGFVLGSITLIASAKDNTLIKNISKTGYLKKLTEGMHTTMGLLLAVCIIFIILLFFPDSFTYTFPFVKGAEKHTYAQLLLQVGIFFLLLTFKNFYITWVRLKQITKLM